jgi:hypothetical protein
LDDFGATWGSLWVTFWALTILRNFIFSHPSFWEALFHFSRPILGAPEKPGTPKNELKDEAARKKHVFFTFWCFLEKVDFRQKRWREKVCISRPQGSPSRGSTHRILEKTRFCVFFRPFPRDVEKHENTLAPGWQESPKTLLRAQGVAIYPRVS